MDLVLIDGPNVFNAVGARLAHALPDRHSDLRSYMADWFDFHRLVQQTIQGRQPPTLGNIIFHSPRQLGKGPYKLSPELARDFWTRQGANPNTSCYVVDIPGDERPTYAATCKNCGKECVTYMQGEKGVDNAMTVYMFECANRWEKLCIFSNDVDFVPAVWALRRRGKQVYVAIDPEETKTALVRAAQSAVSIPWESVLNDFGSYLALRAGGILDSWIAQVMPALNVGFLLTNSGANIYVGVKGSGAEDRIRELAAALDQLAKCGLVVPAATAGGVHIRTSLAGDFYPNAHWLNMRVSDMREIQEPGQIG